MSLWTPHWTWDHMDVQRKTAPAKSAKLLPFVSTRPSDMVSSGVKAGRICSACTVGIPWRFLALFFGFSTWWWHQWHPSWIILGWWNTIQKSSSHQYPFIISHGKSPFWWIFNPRDIHGILLVFLHETVVPWFHIWSKEMLLALRSPMDGILRVYSPHSSQYAGWKGRYQDWKPWAGNMTPTPKI